jgi:hypothetical protein
MRAPWRRRPTPAPAEAPSPPPPPPAPAPAPAPAPTLRSAEHQAELDDAGWTIVPLLEPDELSAVRALLSASTPAPGDPRTGLFNDSWSTDADHKQRISAGLKAVVDPALARWVTPHRTPMLGSIVKWPGERGEVVAHRDPTFVDEQRYRSVGVWCAIDVTDAGNGTLELLAGSHRDAAPARVHQARANLADEHRAEGYVAVDLAPGEALIYDHRVLHRSAPIGGAEPRVVVSGPLIPAGATLRYAVDAGDGTAALVEVDDGFFLDHKLDELDVEVVLARYPTIATFAHPDEALPRPEGTT